MNRSKLLHTIKKQGIKPFKVFAFDYSSPDNIIVTHPLTPNETAYCK